jgi:hypothetical protein
MELLKKIDSYRGDIPRSRFIIRLMEMALADRKNKDTNENIIPVDQSYHAQSTGIFVRGDK